MIAVGNPCKIIREISNEDKAFYYKKNLFETDIYNEIFAEHK